VFLLVAGSAQSRGRADQPIRTQRDRSRPQDQPVESRRSKRRSEKESDSSNKHPPIIVGPLTTNQDLSDQKGEKVFNLPLMIQQPFLREKKEPIQVDISVKLIPKSKKKDKKKRQAQVEEIVIHTNDDKGISNSISMEVVDGNVQVLKETVELIEGNSYADSDIKPVSQTSNHEEQNNSNAIEVNNQMESETVQQVTEEDTQNVVAEDMEIDKDVHVELASTDEKEHKIDETEQKEDKETDLAEEIHTEKEDTEEKPAMEVDTAEENLETT
jgi:hypothetical protein